jgi:glycosyltransferase involved in cell wall biosynthesis
MKIMVTAASFSSEMSGIQRHALNMVRCLLRRPEISRVDLVVAPWQIQLVESAGYCPDGRVTTHVAEMDQSSLSRNLWYYRELPALAARLQPDVVHLSYPMPVDAASLGCPTVVTLHDLYPYEIPRNFRFPHVIFNRLVLRHCLRSVDAIACVSEATMLRLRQYAPRSTWQKSVRIHNCVEPEPHYATRPPIWNWRREPFLLSVAQHRGNKNIGLLIRAFHRLLRASEIDSSMKLVVVGIDGPETQHIHQLVSELDLSRSVLLLRGLSDPELQWCYGRCEALVAPSKTEGFGLPVAEGLLVGCRIICSDIPAFREVGGPHCRYVTLGKGEEEALAGAIKATLQEPQRKPLSLPHLSAEVLADQYVSLYRTLIPSKAPLPIADRAAPTLGAAPKRPLYDRISGVESQSRRDDRGYI